MKKKKGFTLIELIAVLVILAILALIVTPLVMNIIKKSKDAANKRSVDAYARALELAVAEYSLDTGKYPTSLDMVEPKYKGNKVICNVRLLKENGDVYLSECKVNGKEVKDSKTDDGWYHYGEKILSEINYVDMYGKALEKSIKEYYTKNGSIPFHTKLLGTKYTGKEIDCDVTINFDTTVYMTKCIVDNVEITDNQTSDGYYHYGSKKKKGQEYVDDYGQAIELAVANYYTDNNAYPTDIDGLEIDYNSMKVKCSDTRVNDDGTIFLNECKVNNIPIKNESGDEYYHYGISYKKYSIGDKVKYKSQKFYVIKESNERSNVVTLLKEYPLSKYEVNQYGAGHVNRYTSSSVGSAYYYNGYGAVAYYSSETCGYVDNVRNISNCNVSYENSDIKYIVDGWASATLKQDDLIADYTGYSARLISQNDLVSNLGYMYSLNTSNTAPSLNGVTPEFVYNSNYSYWVMDSVVEMPYNNWIVGYDKNLGCTAIYDFDIRKTMVRPVITIKKGALKE